MDWTIDSALRTTFPVLRNNFAAFYAATLVFTTPSLLVSLVDGGLVVSLVVAIIANVLVSVSLTVGTIQAMAGVRPAFATLMQQATRPDIGKLILLGIVQHVVIGLGLVALIVPGLYVLCLWMVAMPAMIVERLAVGEALDRSVGLTRDRRWRVLGAFAVLAIPLGVIAELLGASPGEHILSWLIEAALATVLASLSAVLYALLRGEKEGVTPQQIAAALD